MRKKENLTGIRKVKSLLDVKSNRHAIAYTSCQRHFICILKLSAKGYAACNSGNFALRLLHFFLNVIDRSVALNVGIERKDQFFSIFFLNTLHKLLYTKLIRTNPVER